MDCPCGGDGFSDGCTYVSLGYPWCRPCGEHHRPPECDIDDQGRPLRSCGHPWEMDCDSIHQAEYEREFDEQT